MHEQLVVVYFILVISTLSREIIQLYFNALVFFFVLLHKVAEPRRAENLHSKSEDSLKIREINVNKR